MEVCRKYKERSRILIVGKGCRKSAIIEDFMNEYVNRIKNLPVEKKELLLKKLPPLSFGQQRFWFFEKFENEKSLYNILLPVHITGNLNIEILQRSLNDIIERHNILRTCFPVIEDTPVQLVLPKQNVSLEIRNIEDTSPDEQKKLVKQIIKQQTGISFDVENDILLKAVVIKLNDKEHTVILTIHHLIFDGWSSSILIQELGNLYASYTKNITPRLSPLKIQFGDYAKWEREVLNGEKLAKTLQFWKNKLSDLPPLLELPTDHPRPSVQKFDGHHTTVEISKELAENLKKIFDGQKVSMFMILLAGFYTLLYRYTGRTDIPVGCPVSGRNNSETERLIGLFVNTLVIRTNFSASMTFGELLEAVKISVLEAQEHQNIPFERLVEELKPERNLSYSPIFQVMFSYQKFSGGESGFSDMQINVLDYETGTTQGFDLSLILNESENGIIGSFEYDSMLFEEKTIEQITAHFISLLTKVVENPDIPVSQIDFLNEEEKEDLVGEKRFRRLDFPRDASFPVLFERQVVRTPDAPAVRFGDLVLSYRQLNLQADRLASRLRRLYVVSRETKVAIVLDRSVEMIVAVIAVLKAGGVYVPVDARTPPERLGFLLRDAAPELVLTNRAFAPLFADFGITALALDDLPTDVADVMPPMLRSKRRRRHFRPPVPNSSSGRRFIPNRRRI